MINHQLVPVRSRYKISALVAAVAVLATFAVSLVAAPPSQAVYTRSYCARLVDDYFHSGATNIRCHESNDRHTWNYNQSDYEGTVDLQNVCAAATSGYTDELTDGIYGSGCAADTTHYQFCHSLVSLNYYAWLAQSDYTNHDHTMDGLARAGYTCPGSAAATSSVTSASVRGSATGTVRRLSRQIGRFAHRRARSTIASQVGSFLSDAAPVSGDATPVFDMADAREVGPTGGDNHAFVVPAQDRVCQVLVAGEGTEAASCRPSDSAGGPIGNPNVTVVPGGVAVWGSLPDGATSVQAVTDGVTTSLPIENNGYVATLATWPDSVSWTDSAGVEHTSQLREPNTL